MSEKYTEASFDEYDPSDEDAQARVTAKSDQERAELCEMVNNGKMVLVIVCDKLPEDDEDHTMGVMMKAVINGSAYHTTQFLAASTRIYGENVNKIFRDLLPPEASALYTQLVRSGFGG